MERAKRTESGAYLLAKNGGLLFCSACQKIVGSVNRDGYRFIRISFVCTCNADEMRFIEISRGDEYIERGTAKRKMPTAEDGVYLCKKCRTPMFSMIENRVHTYVFAVRCQCGEDYDMKTQFGKRLGETVKLLKNRKK